MGDPYLAAIYILMEKYRWAWDGDEPDAVEILFFELTGDPWEYGQICEYACFRMIPVEV